MHSVSLEKVNFLDTPVYLASNYLETEIYTKSTNTDQNHDQAHVTLVILKIAQKV